MLKLRQQNSCSTFSNGGGGGNDGVSQIRKKIDWTYAAATAATAAVSDFRLNIIFKHIEINTPWNVIQLYAL